MGYPLLLLPGIGVRRTQGVLVQAISVKAYVRSLSYLLCLYLYVLGFLFYLALSYSDGILAGRQEDAFLTWNVPLRFLVQVLLVKAIYIYSCMFVFISLLCTSSLFYLRT